MTPLYFVEIFGMYCSAIIKFQFHLQLLLHSVQICYPKNVNSVTTAGPNCQTESVNVSHIKFFSVLFWIFLRG